MKMVTATFRIIRQMIRLAMGSRMGQPRRAPPIPISAPIEDSASLRWCQASAMRAEDSMRFAWCRVYQNMPSLTTIDTMAAISASMPGAAMVL